MKKTGGHALYIFAIQVIQVFVLFKDKEGACYLQLYDDMMSNISKIDPAYQRPRGYLDDDFRKKEKENRISRNIGY